jgi:hypothetical protein
MRHLFAAALFFVCLHAKAQQAPQIKLEVSGTAELVSDIDKNGCQRPGDKWIHVPDVPVTAYRRADDSVVLLAVNRRNIPLVGPDIEHVSVGDCKSILESGGNPDPATFMDNEWLLTVIRFPSGRYVGFVHDEYHGWEHNKPACKSGGGELQSHRCWYGGTTYVTSSDGGVSFQRPPSPKNVIAAPPEKFRDGMERVGLTVPKAVFDPRSKRYYLMVSSVAPSADQEKGQCILAGTAEDPREWKAWDGSGFSVSLHSPYEDNGPRKVCKPVLPERLNIWSVKYITSKQLFIGVGQQGRTVIYVTSPDMLSWSKPGQIGPFVPPRYWKPGDPLPTHYYSLLDPSSKSASFDTLEGKPYLYYVQWRVDGKRYNNAKRDIYRRALTLK